MKKPSNVRRPLKLTTENVKPLETVNVDNVVGGRAMGNTFPCWTENNCPAPA